MESAEASTEQVLLKRPNSWMLQMDRTRAEIKEHFEIENFSFFLIGENPPALQMSFVYSQLPERHTIGVASQHCPAETSGQTNTGPWDLPFTSLYLLHMFPLPSIPHLYHQSHHTSPTVAKISVVPLRAAVTKALM